jgi:dTDP-4-dehydrorhamnose 3,5-epimerase
VDGVRYLPGRWQTDERGGFVRLLDDVSDALTGATLAQVSLSTNTLSGTLRGFHALARSALEWKAVSCVRGEVFDVLLDCRPESATYMRSESRTLGPANPGTLIIPPGVAHAYLTLSDHSWVLYGMSSPYDPNLEIGFRWNDPMLGISWPTAPSILSAKDAAWPPLTSAPQL